MTTFKTCKTCGQSKPLPAFGKQTKSRRYRPECKTCRSEKSRQYYEACKMRHRVGTEKIVADLSGPHPLFLEGPRCWCCRNQAVGETPYRLCVICLG